MIKREKKRKLCGSVLLTVVCVMSLLIIFLFGTLALATAANNRAHVNYSTAQTEVTSRTVVDAAIKAMEVNKDFGNAVSALKADEPKPLNVFVDFSGVPDAGKYGHLTVNKMKVDIAPVGKKQFYDENKKEWINGDIIQFTSTVSMAGVDSTTSAYIVKQPPGTKDGTSSGGAGFVTTAGADLSCQTNLYGGSYISLPKKEAAEKYNYSYYDVKVDDNGNVIYEDKSKERKYSEWTTDKSIYRQFDPYDPSKVVTETDKNGNVFVKSNPTAFVLSNSGAVAEDDLYVNNNAVVGNWSGFIFSEGKGVTIWGDMTFGNDIEKFFIENGVSGKELAFNKVPYIYVDGKLSTAGMKNIGNSSKPFPLNIFCGSMETGSNGTNIYADVYCMNPFKTSKIGANSQQTKLYGWAESVIHKTSQGSKDKRVKGSIYSKGSVEFNSGSGMSIQGDVRVEKNCTINIDKSINNVDDVNIEIGGDLVVGGTLDIRYTEGNLKEKSKIIKALFADGSGGKIYCDTVLLNGQPFQNGGEVTYKVPNDKRYYLWYDPKFDFENNSYLGLFGEPLESGERVYYRWAEDKVAGSKGLMDSNYIDEVGNGICNPLNNGDMSKKEYYKQEEDWPLLKKDLPRASDDNLTTDYYYVETTINPNSSDPNKKLTADKINEDGTLKIKDPNNSPFADFEFIRDSSKPTNERYTTCTYTMKADKNLYLPKDDYKNVSTYIYPEEAERDVILGLKTLKESDVKDIPKEETQIVKTVYEVLDKVANPYDNSTPSGMSNASTFKRYESPDDIFKDSGKIAFNVKSDGSYISNDIKTDGTNMVKVSGTEYDKTIDQAEAIHGGGAAPVITKSCVLNMELGNGDWNGLVINPNGSRICIVVEKLDLASGINILVDDSNPGSIVDFYINNNSASSKFSIGGGWLGTTKYCKELSDHNGKVIRYGSGKGGADDLVLEDLGRPRVNIYGGIDSEFVVSNMQFLIANIVSPELKVTVSATAGAPYSFSNVYYNGIDVNKPYGTDITTKEFIIGCLNAKEVSIPNRVNVLYVTDPTGDPPDVAGDEENIFNYRVLYYDEY